MKTILIIISVVLIWLLVPRLLKRLTPWLTRMAFRYAGKKAGLDPDLLRQAFGQTAPPPREEKKRKSSSTRSGARHRTASSEPIIPKEYAVDVEFTEIHTYTEHTQTLHEPPGAPDGKGGFFRRKVHAEEQVSDAEIIEIIPDRN